MARQKKDSGNRLDFVDEADRPTYKLKNGEVVPMSDKRIEAMKRTSWQEGQTGNAKGRPKDPIETKMKLYQYNDEMIANLRDIALNSDNAGAKVKATLAFLTPFVAPAASKQEIDVNVTTRSVSKFLMSITEELETNPSLLIDVTPNEPDDESKD